MGAAPLPNRQEAVEQVRMGLLTTAAQVAQRFGVETSTARDWLREGQGIPPIVRQERKAQPPPPTAFRCSHCLRVSSTPVCECGTVVNPILAQERPDAPG